MCTLVQRDLFMPQTQAYSAVFKDNLVAKLIRNGAVACVPLVCTGKSVKTIQI